MFGVAFEISSRSLISTFRPASFATASVCSTVFDEPPMAISSTRALRNDFAVTKSFARGGFSIFASSTIRRAARRQYSTRSGESAAMVPLPGSAMPSASQRQFMLFAVNIPEQEPGPGQAVHSSSWSCASSILSTTRAATPSKIEFKSVL